MKWYIKWRCPQNAKREKNLWESVYIWICSNLENILFYNWTTSYRIVSIFTTCWRKFVYSRFANFFQSKGLIIWAGLARLAGLFRCAEITFSPVLHEVSQPGWWLMRWNAWDRWLMRWNAEDLILWNAGDLAWFWCEEGTNRSIYYSGKL